MRSNAIRESADRKTQVCPFLGLKDDPATALSFPSAHNRCFHARPAIPIKLEFQRKYCLAINHIYCEEYIREPDSPLPSNLRYRGGSGLRGIFGKAGFWIILLVCVVVVIVWQVLSRGLLGFGKSGQTSEGTIAAFSTNIGLQTPSIPAQVQNTSTPTLVVTASSTFPIQTYAPTIESSHALETPIGNEHKLVIHRVLAGESSHINCQPLLDNR